MAISKSLAAILGLVALQAACAALPPEFDTLDRMGTGRISQGSAFGVEIGTERAVARRQILKNRHIAVASRPDSCARTPPSRDCQGDTAEDNYLVRGLFGGTIAVYSRDDRVDRITWSANNLP